MNSDDLQKHIFATYVNLRIGIAALGLMFPTILWIGGVFKGIGLQSSMSAYYHATMNGASMRDPFVGILFAVGLFLILYRGWNAKENWALNFTGLFAIGVAIFPTEWNCAPNCSRLSLHGFCAISLFLCMAYVCIWCASDTLHLLKNEKLEKKYSRIYKLLGAGMILAPGIALFLTVISNKLHAYTFVAEAIGILIFSSYWLMKSKELALSKAELKVLMGEF